MAHGKKLLQSVSPGQVKQVVAWVVVVVDFFFYCSGKKREQSMSK